MSVQEIFNDISLTKDISQWEIDMDTDEENRKRLKFLGGYEECHFSKLLGPANNPARKNIILSTALVKRAEEAATEEDCLRYFGQALCFSPPGETMDSILRKRADRLQKSGRSQESLSDIKNLFVKTSDEQQKIRDITQPLVTTSTTNEVLSTRHEYLNDFSDAVQVQQTKRAGRFLVAGRDIEPGEIIADESSFVALLDRKFLRTHCDNCLKEVVLLVPCLNCSTVIYCSADCRNKATYHLTECLLLDQIYRADTEVWQLALRIVASQPLEFWTKNNHTEKSAVYSSADVSTVYNLVTHKGQADSPAPVLMKEAMTALFYIRVLQHSGYFIEAMVDKEDSLGGCELDIGILLLHFMRVVFYNSHEVTELQKTKGTVKKIGVCLNPALALINHSCDPNYARVVKGRRSLAFATRLIKKGEEVLDVYSPTFFMADRLTRREVTTRYNFDCMCAACAENWPAENKMGNKTDSTSKSEVEDVKLLDTSIKKVLSSSWKSCIGVNSKEITKETNSEEVKTLESAIKEVSNLLSQARLKIMHPNKFVLQLEVLLHSLLWEKYYN